MNLELFKQKIKRPINLKNIVCISDNTLSPLYENNTSVVKHYSPSTEEWNNSIHTFNKNKLIKFIPAINMPIYKLLKYYFNMNPSLKLWTRSNKQFRLDKSWKRRLSVKKLFISIPKIKHSNHKVNINIYIYNRKKLYYINKLVKLIKFYKKKNLNIPLFKVKKLKKKHLSYKTKSIQKLKKKQTNYKIKLLKKNWIKRNIIFKHKIKNISVLKLFFYSINYFQNKKKKLFYVINNLKNLKKDLVYTKKLKKEIGLSKDNINIIKQNMWNTIYKIKKEKALKKKIILYEYYISMLYFNNYLFNNNNLLPLKNILKTTYLKKIELNIINLKYLYLDSNIFAEAITRKLVDRKKRVLRVLKLGLKITKKPFFKIHFHKDIVKLYYKFMDKNLNMNIFYLKNDLSQNKYIMNKPSIYKTRLILYHMKQKIISGIRLEGSGRLTKRLTASRSISKYKYKGSLKNLNSSYEGLSAVMLRGFVKSNLQYININNHNRNGSFGIKVSVSVY